MTVFSLVFFFLKKPLSAVFFSVAVCPVLLRGLAGSSTVWEVLPPLCSGAECLELV